MREGTQPDFSFATCAVEHSSPVHVDLGAYSFPSGHKMQFEQTSAHVHPQTHTLACEAGGLSMVEFVHAMQRDATSQEKLVKIIANVLEDAVRRNDMLKRKSNLDAFEGTRPGISLSSYIRRMVKYGGLSPCCFVVALIYLERLKERSIAAYVTSRTFQRLLLVAVLEATKYLDDYYYSNKHWAEIGGISTKELNSLELEFLFRLGFSLHVTRDEYDRHANQLLAQAAGTADPYPYGEGLPPAPIPEEPALAAAAAAAAADEQRPPAGEGCGMCDGEKACAAPASYSNVADAAACFEPAAAAAQPVTH